MTNPTLLVLASGTKDDGGSGFENLCKQRYGGVLNAEIVSVVSNHEYGGVRRHADHLGVPFIHFPGPWTAENYREIFDRVGADYVALSGWIKPVRGHDPRKTFNIQPGPLPQFGGAGMYGHHVHEAVMTAYRRGGLTHSCVSMHYVTEEYDEGPVIFRCDVPIFKNDTADSLGKRVNAFEHVWQPKITNMVVNEEITWSGIVGELPQFPRNYDYATHPL